MSDSSHNGSGDGEGSRRLRILVVDDEQAIVATLRVILEHFGHEVDIAYDGEEALSVARRFSPDLLLSDVIMPGKDGIEAAIEIRKMLPACAVLLISGNAHVNDLLEKAHAQDQDFELLAKPVHPLELMQRIGAVCGIPTPSLEPE